MNVDDLQHDPEWLEDDSPGHRMRVLISAADQERFAVADTEWFCRHCGELLADEWDRCACRAHMRPRV